MAEISSTLSFQDRMSSVLDSINRRLNDASTSAKIAKDHLQQLEATQKAYADTVQTAIQVHGANSKEVTAAMNAYDKASKEYDKGAARLEKYNKQVISAQLQLKNAETQLKQYNGTIDQTNNKNNQAAKGFESMSGKIVTLSTAFQLFNQAKAFISGINAKINEFVGYARIQTQAEDQLAIITKQRMALNDDEVRSLYALASAQQRVGVVGDEATIAGMASISAFTTQKKSIEALTPAMDNLAVKMYGYDVNASNMETVSKALGKAMQGDVGQLSRMGIKIDDVTKKRLMHLNEEQRAVELAKIIKNVTSDMNEEMAKTPYGQITQAQNRLGDSYERLGNMLLPIQAIMVKGWEKIVTVSVQALETLLKVVAIAIDPLAKIFLTLFVGIATYATTYYGILVAKTIWAATVTAAQWTWSWLQTIAMTKEVIAANIVASAQTAIAWLKNIPILLQNAVSMGVIQVQSILAGKAAFGAGLKAAGGWLLANIPLLATIAIIGALIFAFVKLNKSVEDVLNFIIDKFVDMGQTILGVLQNIAEGIDSVFHTNLASGISSLSDKLEKARVKAHSGAAKIQSGLNGVAGNIKGVLSPRDILGVGTGAGVGAGLDGLTTNTSGGKALKTQNQGDIGIKEEDMELLHDLATEKFAQYYQQLTPTLTIPNMVIHETADVNEVLGAITSSITGFVRSSTYNTDTGSQQILPA